MRAAFVLVCVGCLMMVGVRAASAHHSFAATYLDDQMVTIEGDLVQFLFRNPHSFVHVLVTDKNGNEVRYAIEWSGSNQLGEQGVTRETLKAGDHVIVTGTPGRNPADHRLRMISLRRPKDGFRWVQRSDANELRRD